MTAPRWDDVLDEIQHGLDLVEDALAADEPVPTLPPFRPPADVMPVMTADQRRRAEALMRRQSEVSRRVSEGIVATRIELGEVRRRRRAAAAYGRPR